MKVRIQSKTRFSLAGLFSSSSSLAVTNIMAVFPAFLCLYYSRFRRNFLRHPTTMTDRYNIHSQLEHLQSKYIGTGHADTSKWEWLVNQHRDSYCSYMGHFDLLNYFSVAENESKARVRFNLMEKMLQPCGPPVDKPDDS